MAASLAMSAPARADVLPADRVDASADVLDLGGVAMADDGTGGVVYRRREDGRPHIFVSRFTGSNWTRPQRVDSGQQFESTWPRIAAASRGRLLVTWVQPARRTVDGTINSLYAAWKAPGSATFTAPTVVDPDVGSGVGLFPSLALAANGGAGFLTYVRQQGDLTEFRLAQFRGGLTWSRRPIPRRSNRALSSLTAETAPKVSVDATGNAVVGYIEPDQDNIDRVYARRVFSGDLSVVPLLASPAAIDGRPVTGAADQFAMSVGGFGEASFVIRQQLDASSSAAQVFVNTLPPIFTEGAKDFTGARALPAPAAGIPAGVSAGTNTDGGGFRVAYGLGSTFVLTTSADGVALGSPIRVGTPGNIAPGVPKIVMGPKGAAVLARRLTISGLDGVEVREVPASGVQRRAQVASLRGGLVTGVEVAGSGFGDGLVAFRSESQGAGEISAATVDAAPGTFAVTTPTDWVRPTRARVTWEPASNALGRLRYEVYLDGTKATEQTSGVGFRFPRAGLEDGRHRVQVRAVDRRGQRTLSNQATMKVDGTAPQVTVTARRGRRAAVRITDRGRSGLDTERSKVAWGDGDDSPAANQLSHTYTRACRCRVTVTATDRAGNRRTVRTRVVVK